MVKKPIIILYSNLIF